MTFLEVKDLEVEFQVDKKSVKPIERISFEMNEGEVLGIVGETGSGKSLTAHAILGLSTLVEVKLGEASNLRNGSFFRFQNRRCSQFEVRKLRLFPRIR